MSLLITVGHSPKNKGARTNKDFNFHYNNEYDINRYLVLKAIIDEYNNKREFYNSFHLYYNWNEDNVKYSKKAEYYTELYKERYITLHIDLHFNSVEKNNKSGSECIVWNSDTNAIKYGEIFLKKFCNFFTTKNRKVKERFNDFERGGLLLHQIKDNMCSSIMLEPLFLSNLDNCYILETPYFYIGYARLILETYKGMINIFNNES